MDEFESYEVMKEKKNEEKARAFTDLVNDMCFDYRGVCDMIAKKTHRALQENFTILCLEWLKKCAEDDYRFDARNEYSHKIGKKLSQYID